MKKPINKATKLSTELRGAELFLRSWQSLS